jgi:hypothetical protein
MDIRELGGAYNDSEKINNLAYDLVRVSEGKISFKDFKRKHPDMDLNRRESLLIPLVIAKGSSYLGPNVRDKVHGISEKKLLSG